MPPVIRTWTAADGLRSIADNTTSTVIALLSLIGVATLGYGLVRAIVMNRRSQIVLADLMAPSDYTELAGSAMLSPVVRQYVRQQITDQRTQVTRIGTDILAPASRELELRLDDGIDRQIQRSANDSIATLLAALRAVTPDAADRFAGLFSAILPPPRGVSVSIALIQLDTSTMPRIGVSAEIIKFDGRPLGSEIFWEPVPVSSAEPRVRLGNNEQILRLLEPVTRWIAIRLVLTLMISPRRRVTSRARQGLRRLLAGGLFLQAMRDFPDQALAFGEQARAELEQARLLLPQISLPVTTLAGVHERVGWAQQMVGEPERASGSFRAAIGLWQAAEKIAQGNADSAEAQLSVLQDRRLKAQFASGDPASCAAALAELGSIRTPSALAANRVWLYNRACLYAQASKVDSTADYQKLALRWLGLALMSFSGSGMWDYAAKRDPELEPIRRLLGSFLISLRSLIPSDPAQLNQMDAKMLVDQAISRAASPS